MLNFLEFLQEDAGIWPGNYVAATTNDPVLPEDLLPKSGTRPIDKSHITLMYSEFTDVDPRIIENFLKTVPQDFEVKPTGFELFDSKKDGELIPEKSTLVMRVDHPFLYTIFESLVSLGMEHSYPEFSPHVTIAYDVDREDAFNSFQALNNWLSITPVLPVVEISSIYQQPIDKDWVSKL